MPSLHLEFLEISAVILMGLPVYVTWRFSTMAFILLSLFYTFNVSTIIFCGGSSLDLSVWNLKASWTWITMSFLRFEHFMALLC
jgi:hypothetical protein